MLQINENSRSFSNPKTIFYLHEIVWAIYLQTPDFTLCDSKNRDYNLSLVYFISII